MDLHFEALLKDLNGKLIEIGRGVYNAAGRSVDFESDFVPLFPMGEQLQVVRVHDHTEVHRFIGEVYLSSANKLRLVGVKEEMLPGAALVYLYYVNLDGEARTQLAASQRRLLFFHRQVERELTFPVRVQALSMKEVRFNTDLSVELPAGQLLSLSLPQGPEIWNIPLIVQQAILLGQQANCYRCQIGALSAVTRLQMESFVRRLCAAAQLRRGAAAGEQATPGPGGEGPSSGPV